MRPVFIEKVTTLLKIERSYVFSKELKSIRFTYLFSLFADIEK